jgi:DNA-binding ferritin-like protein (Dps family)
LAQILGVDLADAAAADDADLNVCLHIDVTPFCDQYMGLSYTYNVTPSLKMAI